MFRGNIYSTTSLPTVCHNFPWALLVGSELCIVNRSAHRLLIDGLENVRRHCKVERSGDEPTF